MITPLDAVARLDVPLSAGRAIKALAAGAANEDQQRAAFDFIVRHLCRTDEMVFAPDGDVPNLMAWRDGRRFVGLKLREIVATPEPEPAAPPEPRKNTGPKPRSARRSKGGWMP